MIPVKVGDSRVCREPEKCLCGGKGAFYLYEPAYYDLHTYWVGDIEAVPITYEEYLCPWHSKEGREQIRYPDGWPEEDLAKWCKEQNVPEPEWMPKRKMKDYSYLKPGFSTGVTTISYSGGKQITANFVYDNPAADHTWGSAQIDAKVQEQVQAEVEKAMTMAHSIYMTDVKPFWETKYEKLGPEGLTAKDFDWEWEDWVTEWSIQNKIQKHKEKEAKLDKKAKKC